MIHVQVNSSYRETINIDILIKTAEAAIERISPNKEIELSLVLESDTYIQNLNREYRQIDAPTDVLSFPSGDFEDPESGMTYIGDIIIAVPKTIRQAAQAGHTQEAELQLMVVHGVLHLLGFDHADEEEKWVMWQHQAEILEALGVKINSLPED